MKIVPISAFQDNYIWALVHDGHCAIVDPGDARPVREYLREHELDLCAIVLTHRHPDHVGGVKDLIAAFDVPVFGPQTPAIPHVTIAVKDADCLTLPALNAEFEVIAVPGHTEEHVAYYGKGLLFCGDTLFAAGCGRLLGGTAAQLHGSLQRLARLPPDTQIFCAHEYTMANLRFAQAVEPDNLEIVQRLAACAGLRAAGKPSLPSRLQDELRTNPFLRCHTAAVAAAVASFSGVRHDNEDAVFAALRKWKDQF